MIKIFYMQMIILISSIWCLQRGFCAVKRKKVNWKRELQLLLVYICIIVVARYVFFPFSKVDGVIQPLVFDKSKAFPFRINLIPLVYLFDYPELSSILKNVIGNVAMFIPIGIVYPIVYKDLDTHKKVIAAGVGFSFVIEILQLPFYDRVSDIDDLILNSLGYFIGYGVYLLVRRGKRKKAYF